MLPKGHNHPQNIPLPHMRVVMIINIPKITYMGSNKILSHTPLLVFKLLNV